MLALIFIICISFFLSAFFSGVETAFTSLTKIQQHVIIAKYPLRGKILQKLLQNPMLVLSTILIGNTTANTSFSIALSQIVIQIFGNQGLAIATGVITLFLLIFCEISPKQFALQFNEKIILKVLIPLYVFRFIFFPLSLILNKVASLLHKFIAKDDAKNNSEILTRSHLANLFYNAQSQGELELQNTHAITRILNFSNLSIESIMVRRQSVISFSSTSTIEDVQSIVNQHIYGNYPIYEKDDIEHIIGIVQLHDILAVNNKNKIIKQLIQKAIFIHESKPVHEVIELLRIRNITLAIIIDEFGGFSGIVSIKDIMRYIFDFDNAYNHKAKTSELFIELDSQRILLDTSVLLTELEEYTGTVIDPNHESNTIGGYILEITQNIPTVGSVIDTVLGRFRILRVKKNRILSLLWILRKEKN